VKWRHERTGRVLHTIAATASPPSPPSPPRLLSSKTKAEFDLLLDGKKRVWPHIGKMLGGASVVAAVPCRNCVRKKVVCTVYPAGSQDGERYPVVRCAACMPYGRTCGAAAAAAAKEDDNDDQDAAEGDCAGCAALVEWLDILEQEVLRLRRLVDPATFQ